MLLYRVVSEQLNGMTIIWWFDEDEEAAKRKIRKLANEKTLKTVWAEFETCMGGKDDPDTGWETEYGFEREVAVVLGHKMLTGRITWH